MQHIANGEASALHPATVHKIEHNPEALLERLRVASEQSIRCNQLKIVEARRLMDHLESSLRQSTFLQG